VFLQALHQVKGADAEVANKFLGTLETGEIRFNNYANTTTSRQQGKSSVT